MNSIIEIQSKIQQLFNTNPNIHVSKFLSNPKIAIVNKPARIIGVYSHIFQIEYEERDLIRTLTIQYPEILTKQTEIAELN